VAVLVLAGAAQSVPLLAEKAAEIVKLYPLISVGFVAGILMPRYRRARPVLLAGIAVAVGAAVAATLLPSTSPLWHGVRDEITGKTLQYWGPLFLAAGSAGALAALWNVRRETAQVAARLATTGLVVLMTLPLHRGTPDFLENSEHRLADQISIGLNRAERGAFVNWPDARNVIDEPRRELTAAVRREQHDGRLGPHDRVLHVAAQYYSWVATPVAVFNGAIETSLTTNPDTSPHAYGGRLLDISALPRLLGSRYRYVLLEPGGLPQAPSVRSEIEAVGYASVFANAQGELFRLGQFRAPVTPRP
jgi:hypothetical protein